LSPRASTRPATDRVSSNPETGSGLALPERYEDALSELERMVASMEAGQMPLETLLENYQRGAALLQHCRSRLEAVEQQVKVLEDGQLKPWTASP
jgi:exodeoxyribonuclease VII small subunit